MTLRRWEPVREFLTLREAMDRMFDDALVQRPAEAGRAGLSVPVDVVDRENEIVVTAPVPGFESDKIDISIQGDVLTIKGTMEHSEEREQENYYLREWRSGSFERAVRLPCVVASDKADAEHKDGVLTIHLPKMEQEITRRIEVKAG